MDRPETTLFMLMSLDGKISTGGTDARDVDVDFPKIPVVKDGVFQYYDYEQTTALHSFNSGRVLAKVGINAAETPSKTPVSFVVTDNTHLTRQGVRNLIAKSDVFYLITSNEKHPAFDISADNMNILFYKDKIDYADAFSTLKARYGIREMTVQTGATLNALLVREGLIDFVDVFIAPVLIGGTDTASLIGGESLETEKDLTKIKPLELSAVERYRHGYVRLKYKVLNESEA